MFSILNWIHLKYRQEAKTISTSKSLETLVNMVLVSKHDHNRMPSSDQSTVNYQLLKKDGMIGTKPAGSDSHFETSSYDYVTGRGWRTARPLIHLMHRGTHYGILTLIFWLLATAFHVSIHIYSTPAGSLMTWANLTSFVTCGLFFFGMLIGVGYCAYQLLKTIYGYRKTFRRLKTTL